MIINLLYPFLFLEQNMNPQTILQIRLHLHFYNIYTALNYVYSNCKYTLTGKDYLEDKEAQHRCIFFIGVEMMAST